MGGADATDSMEEAPQTQVWLATGEDEDAQVSGKYFFHKRLKSCAKAGEDVNVQERYLETCEQISKIKFLG